MAQEEIYDDLTNGGKLSEVTSTTYIAPTERLTFKAFVEEIEEMLNVEPRLTTIGVSTRAKVLCSVVYEIIKHNKAFKGMTDVLEDRLNMPPIYFADDRPIEAKVADLLSAHWQEQSTLELLNDRVDEFPGLAMDVVEDYLGINIDRLDPMSMNRLESAIERNTP